MKVTLDHTEDVALNIKSFWFKPEQNVRYIAGQFTEIRLPHENQDNRGDKRWFTLSSSPTEDMVSITTKFAGKKSSSFKKTFFELMPGHKLTLAEPMGDFVLPKDLSLPVLFVAGGIGVTPMRSMIKWLSDTKEHRQVQMIYAANTIEEVAFSDLFESYCESFHIVLGSPDKNWRGESGRVDVSTIERLADGLDNKQVYLAGPEPMVEKLDKDFKAFGINKRQIATDFFPGY